MDLDVVAGSEERPEAVPLRLGAHPRARRQRSRAGRLAGCFGRALYEELRSGFAIAVPSCCDDSDGSISATLTRNGCPGSVLEPDELSDARVGSVALVVFVLDEDLHVSPGVATSSALPHSFWS
jgi:hypothetical protein